MHDNGLAKYLESDRETESPGNSGGLGRYLTETNNPGNLARYLEPETADGND